MFPATERGESYPGGPPSSGAPHSMSLSNARLDISASTSASDSSALSKTIFAISNSGVSLDKVIKITRHGLAKSVYAFKQLRLIISCISAFSLSLYEI